MRERNIDDLAADHGGGRYFELRVLFIVNVIAQALLCFCVGWWAHTLLSPPKEVYHLTREIMPCPERTCPDCDAPRLPKELNIEP